MTGGPLEVGDRRVPVTLGPEHRRRIGVHTCPGGDQDSTHSADVDYAALLPALFRLNAGAFHIQLASEPDRPRVLRAIASTPGRGSASS